MHNVLYRMSLCFVHLMYRVFVGRISYLSDILRIAYLSVSRPSTARASKPVLATQSVVARKQSVGGYSSVRTCKQSEKDSQTK